jgi:hypothetical protein
MALPRRAWLGILAFAALLLTAPGADAQAQGRSGPLVELLGGSHYQLQPAKTIVLSVPIRMGRGVRMGRLRLVVVNISRDDQADASLTEAFDAELKPGPRRLAPVLRISAADPPQLEQGTYLIRLSVLSRDRPRRRQTLRLTVLVPAAQLRQPKPQTITAKVWWPWETAEETRTLTLRETGRRSWLGSIRSIRGDTGSESDEWLVIEPPGEVARADSAPVTMTLGGKYPTGDTTGTFEVDSPQLAAPVTVEYTITKQLEWVWIAALALGGALLGTFTRVIAVRYAERAKARERAEMVDADLGRRLEKSDLDQTLREDLQDLRAALQREIAGERDGATLLKAVKDVETERTAALERDVQRTEDARTMRSRWEEIFGVEWHVPKATQDRLDEARQPFGRAAAALAQRNTKQAIAECEEIDRLLAPKQLLATARAWRQTTARFADATEHLPFPAGGKSQLDTARTELVQRLEYERVGNGPDADTWVVLSELDTAVRARQDFVATATQLVVDAIDKAANAAGRPAPSPVMTAARAAVLSARNEAGPSNALEPVTEQLNAALLALRGEILARSQQADEKVGKEVEQALTENRYVEASRLAPRLEPAARPPQAVGPAAEASTEPSSAGEPAGETDWSSSADWGATSWDSTSGWGSGWDERTGGKVSRAFGVVWRWLATAARWTRAQIGRLWRRLKPKAIRFVQVMVTAVLVTVAALVLFRSTWVGTADQMVAVFLWGYGVNLSADALVTIASKSTPGAGTSTGVTTTATELQRT